MEREAQALERTIIDLSGNIATAKAERQHKQGIALIPAQKPATVALRQGDTQPAINPVELAQRLKNQFFEVAKTAWNEAEAKRCTQQADDLEKHYWLLRGQEPKEPLLFGRKEWQTQHDVWVDQINGIRQEALALDKHAKATRDGGYDSDRDKVWTWDKQAQERLEQEYPELAQTLKAHHLAEQQKAKTEARVDKTLSDFKALATKHEGKFFGYNDDGKKWNALPEKLRTMIEGFNQLPKEARAMTLEGMREIWLRKPEAAEQVTQQLEQAKGQNQDRGMSR